MNPTLAVALIIGVPIPLLFILAGRRFIHTPTLSGLFVVLGSGSLLVMVLTHVAEGLHLFPSMGWGQRHSPGHYLDLVGVYAGRWLRRCVHYFGNGTCQGNDQVAILRPSSTA
jgi:hypothetical protein